MSWRTALTLVLLVAAALSGWSVWTHRPDDASALASEARSDYTLHDFELVALDRLGKEAFTLRAPQLKRHSGDRTMTLVTPLFLLPTNDGGFVICFLASFDREGSPLGSVIYVDLPDYFYGQNDCRVSDRARR